MTGKSIKLHDNETRNNQEDDGDNELGWRVYIENWGQIESDSGNIHFAVAIKPAYMWYGK